MTLLPLDARISTYSSFGINMRPSWIFILVLFGVYGKIYFDHPYFIMLKYSASELFQFDHSAPPATCVQDTLHSLHLLRRPKYVHRGSRRNLQASGAGITSVWTQRRLDRRHLSPRRVCPANFSYLQKSTASSGGVRLDTLRFAHLNARSINNKAASICDIVVDKELDFFCLCETWHQTNDYLNLNICAPPDYTYIDRPRSTGRGGGLAVIYRSVLL